MNGIGIQQYVSRLREWTSKYGSEVLQTLLVRAVTEILLNKDLQAGQPRRTAWDGQVQSIRRIAYNLGDTVLLARTGYGKSIVFQAVSAMIPHTVTIQVVPLTKLGEEQCNIIAGFGNTTSILIDQSMSKVSTRPLNT